jgi:uncharacterized protein (TIGR03435 family)
VLRISTITVVCWIAAGIAAWGQAGAAAGAGQKPAAYEIISIKPDKSGAPGTTVYRLPDGFRDTNMPLAMVVRGAYDIVLESQMVGMPAWADSDGYDIEAKVDAGTAEEWKKLTWKERWKQEQSMLQALLADRCNLKVHFETRELPVYDLVIAKGGLKMKEAAPGEGNSEGLGPGKMTAHAASIDSLIYGFSGMVGRMIVDQTGLGEKKFDFELRWTPDDQHGAEPADAGPSFFTALEEQIGLKLVPSKGPVQVLVIDHMERPSAN